MRIILRLYQLILLSNKIGINVYPIIGAGPKSRYFFLELGGTPRRAGGDRLNKGVISISRHVSRIIYFPVVTSLLPTNATIRRYTLP